MIGLRFMKKMFSKYPDVVSVSELMDMLHIGKNTAYELLQSGKIKSIKIGKSIEFLKALLWNICNVAKT